MPLLSTPETSTFTAPVCGPFDGQQVARLRQISLRGLARMYRRDQRLFGFCIRRGRSQDALEGISRRYTAITLLGLAGEPGAAAREVLGGDSPHAVGERLLSDVAQVTNLGDVALTLWAAQALGIADRSAAYERLKQLGPLDHPQATVELSWALVALTLDSEWPGAAELRDAVARRLLSAHEPQSGLFRHAVGGRRGGLRGHVACFADVVYPVHALSTYFGCAGDDAALSAAEQCARRACELQGEDGQWWWHYDTRNGRVVEGYPVYSVHQDSMAPLALLALADAGGTNHAAAIQRGLDWLERSPELGGKTLIDDEASLIWRKVARREPRKLTRRLQAAASAVHPALRLPGVNALFPPVAVDWESRPYHLGWVLYAWSPARLARWGISKGTT